MAETQNHADDPPPPPSPPPAPAEDDPPPPPSPPPPADDPPLGPREGLALILHQIGVGNLICKLRKQVDKSNATAGQSRLQLTYELAKGFLDSGEFTADEMNCIHSVEHKGLLLDGYDRDGNRYDGMRFSRVAKFNRSNGNGGVYRIKGFGRFVTARGLLEDHTVVAWVFRLPEPEKKEEEIEVAEAATAAKTEEEKGKKGEAAARYAVMLLNYGSSDAEEVDELVEIEDKALLDLGAMRGLLQLGGAAAAAADDDDGHVKVEK